MRRVEELIVNSHMTRGERDVVWNGIRVQCPELPLHWENVSLSTVKGRVTVK